MDSPNPLALHTLLARLESYEYTIEDAVSSKLLPAETLYLFALSCAQESLRYVSIVQPSFVVDPRSSGALRTLSAWLSGIDSREQWVQASEEAWQVTQETNELWLDPDNRLFSEHSHKQQLYLQHAVARLCAWCAGQRADEAAVMSAWVSIEITAHIKERSMPPGTPYPYDQLWTRERQKQARLLAIGLRMFLDHRKKLLLLLKLRSRALQETLQHWQHSLDGALFD